MKMKRPETPDVAFPYLQKLRDRNVKVTPNRRSVLVRFLEAEKPWTLRSLHRNLSLEDAWDLSSVYRTLETLREAGLLEEFRLPGEKQTYYSLIKQSPLKKAPAGNAHGHIHSHGQLPGAAQPRSHGQAHGNPNGSGHHHHHIVCQDCGK